MGIKLGTGQYDRGGKVVWWFQSGLWASHLANTFESKIYTESIFNSRVSGVGIGCCLYDVDYIGVVM